MGSTPNQDPEDPMAEAKQASIRWIMIGWVAVSVAVALLILKGLIGADALK